MRLITRNTCFASLQAMRPNIYKFGEQLDDVTTHAATRRTVESHARGFDASHDPRYADVFTTLSSLSGENIHRFNSLMEILNVATLPCVTKRICQDIGGGIIETGCFPSYRDFNDPAYGHLVQRTVKAGGSFRVETRVRAARLSEWLTMGAGVPGCIHGGGSPDGAKRVVRARTPVNE